MNTSNTSILLVDDEIDSCLNLADIFNDLGYQVDIASSGETALELVRKRRYDIALLDLMMPGMDGATLASEMKKERSGTVTVIITAHPGSPRAVVALAGGAQQLLSKPVDIRKVIGLIEDVADQPLLLVVDDDLDLCTNLWDLLREQGYRVCIANDVATAVGRIKDDDYKVVLLDMKLPDGNGTQVLQQMRHTGHQPQVIVITGGLNETAQRTQQVLDASENAVMYKPINVPLLLKTLLRLTSGTIDEHP
ncbi:MAG: Response regulator receiver protein [Planctomycetaceae bacterium]|nr:Response regulator receiver protein [Planctomycetaceae bacterium]